jgi:hypothetical protein
MKSIFAVLIALALSSIISLAASVPLGFIIYTDPPSTYVNGAEFSSYANTNSAYSTITRTDGESEQVWNSGIIGIINYPEGQPSEADAAQALRYIQDLQRKCPQEEFRAYFQAAYTRWQNALTFARRSAEVASQATPSAMAPAQTANDQTLSFVTRDGSKYENVELKGRDGGGITVMTDSGIEHIDFERLEKDLQVRFHYDPAKAAAYRQAVAASQQASADQARQVAEANQASQITAVPVLPTKRIQITPGVEITEDQRRQIAEQQQADDAREAAAQNGRNASLEALWDSQPFNQEKFVAPDNLTIIDGPTYQETIDFINGRLAANHRAVGIQSIGFGEKSKKLMFKTTAAGNAVLDSIAMFNPMDISAEVQERTFSRTFGDNSSTTYYDVVLTAKDHKQSILDVCLTDQVKPPRLVQSGEDSLVVFETEDNLEADKMTKAFAHLLALLGATKEAF